jgi:dolichyl-phosphate-mannose--protein O-mannosyl transferase
MAGQGHPVEHHRVAYSVETILVLGLIALGIASAVALVGFFTGSWVLGSFAFPAVAAFVFVIAAFSAGRGHHEDPNKELHDIE